MSSAKSTPDNPDPAPLIAGIVVAGGLGSRLAYQDKPLLVIGGQTVLDHIVAAAGNQVSPLLLNINRNLSQYEHYGLPLVPDRNGSGAGPLAGILEGMEWLCQHRPDTRYLACFPGDTPWFPADIVNRMFVALQQAAADVAWLNTGGQLQPLFSLWRVSLRPAVAAALDKKLYSPRYFIESCKHIVLEYEREKSMFLNINDDVTLAHARALADDLKFS